MNHIIKQIHPCLIVLLMLFSANKTLTAQSPERPVELTQYLSSAIENNPDIRAAFWNYRANLETIPQVGTLPDPRVMIGYFANSENPESFLGRFSFGVEQMFPWFGTLSAQSDAQSLQAKASFHQFESAANRVIAEVEQSWFDYYLFEQTVLLMEQQLELLEELEPVITSRYASAQVTQVDLLRLQMEIDRQRVMVLNHHDQIKPTLIAFNKLLNRRSFDLIDIPGQLAFPILGYQDWQLQEMVSQANPVLMAYTQTEQSLRKSRDAASKEGLPQFSVGLEIMGPDFAGMMLMDKPGIVGAVGVSVPIFRNRYNARVDQFRYEESRVQSEQNAIKNTLETEIIRLHKLYRNAQRDYQLYAEQLIPKAEQASEIILEAYAAGVVGFEEILQIQRDVVQYKLDKQEAIVRGWKLISEMEALVGGFTKLTEGYE